jgi:4-hydroxybenzoyl-CoA thioesterase
MIARGTGVPIVDLKTGFVGMCRFGDEVIISLNLFRLGASSIGMNYEIHSASQTTDKGKTLKLHAKAVVVYSQLAHGKALQIPDALRAALQPYLEIQPESKA